LRKEGGGCYSSFKDKEVRGKTVRPAKKEGKKKKRKQTENQKEKENLLRGRKGKKCSHHSKKRRALRKKKASLKGERESDLYNPGSERKKRTTYKKKETHSKKFERIRGTAREKRQKRRLNGKGGERTGAPGGEGPEGTGPGVGKRGEEKVIGKKKPDEDGERRREGGLNFRRKYKKKGAKESTSRRGKRKVGGVLRGRRSIFGKKGLERAIRGGPEGQNSGEGQGPGRDGDVLLLTHPKKGRDAGKKETPGDGQEEKKKGTLKRNLKKKTQKKGVRKRKKRRRRTGPKGGEAHGEKGIRGARKGAVRKKKKIEKRSWCSKGKVSEKTAPEGRGKGQQERRTGRGVPFILRRFKKKHLPKGVDKITTWEGN